MGDQMVETLFFTFFQVYKIYFAERGSLHWSQKDILEISLVCGFVYGFSRQQARAHITLKKRAITTANKPYIHVEAAACAVSLAG